MIASAVAGSAVAIDSAQHQRAEIKTRAAHEKVKAKDTEIERRRRLVGVLATRNALAAATGTAPTGSTANLMMRDGRLADLDNSAGRANLASTISMLNKQASFASRQGFLGATSSLLGGYAQAKYLGTE